MPTSLESFCLSGCFSKPQYIALTVELANKGRTLGRDRSRIAGLVRPSIPNSGSDWATPLNRGATHPQHGLETFAPPAVVDHNIWWLAETTG